MSCTAARFQDNKFTGGRFGTSWSLFPSFFPGLLEKLARLDLEELTQGLELLGSEAPEGTGLGETVRDRQAEAAAGVGGEAVGGGPAGAEELGNAETHRGNVGDMVKIDNIVRADNTPGDPSN